MADDSRLYFRQILAGMDIADDDPQKRFWLVATLWEAALGLGDDAALARWDAEAGALKVPQWMHDSRQEQGRKLRELLASYRSLQSA